MQKLEERFNELLDGQIDPAKLKRQWFKYLSIIIKEAITRFPKFVDLRILNAYIQKDKLKNEFKAIFEMMDCE